MFTKRSTQFLFFGLFLVTQAFCQSNSSQNFDDVYPFALRGEMNKVFELLENFDDDQLTEKELKKKQGFYARFKTGEEKFDYNTEDPEIIELYDLFLEYWNSVIFEKESLENADAAVRDKMVDFLAKYYAKDISKQEIRRRYYPLFQEYFRSKGMNGRAMGKTLPLYDLYLWKNQEETTYNIQLPETKVDVKVVFMDDFISNGWSHYTTLGTLFSGGWATREKLFCVRSAYNTESENFEVSYLAHEGQHFADFIAYPKLQQPDLEYRAKLTELVMAKTTHHQIINKFIGNAKNAKNLAHPFANYAVIRDLSQHFFNTDFERDSEKWKQIDVKKISAKAKKLLKQHSKELKKAGAETVESWVNR